MIASTSPSLASTSTAQSPSMFVYPSSLPPAMIGRILSLSGSEVRPTVCANVGMTMILSMRSMLILGLFCIIAARITV